MIFGERMTKQTPIIFLVVALFAAGLVASAYFLDIFNTPTPSVNITLDKFDNELDLQRYIVSSLISGEKYTDYMLPLLGGFAPTLEYHGSSQMTAEARGGIDYSFTNVQVEGIDEADYVKTDGEYIYFKNESKILIAKAYPPDELKIVSEITLENTSISGIYIYNDKLIVLTSTGGYFYILESRPDVVADQVRSAIYPPPKPRPPTSNVYVYDVSDKDSPELIHNLTFPGTLFQSRLTDGKLYLIINQYVYGENRTVLLPSYVNDGTNITIPAEAIYYLDGLHEYGYEYAIIFSVDIDSWIHSVTTILSGSTSTIYMSYNNIYLAQPVITTELLTSEGSRRLQKTAIIKIKVDGLEVKPSALVVVDGIVNEQFQMDEYNGYLRVSTHVWEFIRKEKVVTSKTYTNIYILNEKLEVVGSLTGVGESEQLYATRFMGDYAYLVTFRRIDPLFVIDLSNPIKPKVVGELKIPGFSDMLQPIGDGLLIGIGFINEDGANKLKISLFNISDPTNPTEISNLTIGEKWATSEAAYNHKAILVISKKGIFGIPVSTYEWITAVVNKSNNNITITYQQPVYKYILFNTSEGRLQVIKEITINTSITDGYDKPLFIWLEYVRGIYIENNIYIVSPRGIILEELTK